jgi:hypothetical protein
LHSSGWNLTKKKDTQFSIPYIAPSGQNNVHHGHHVKNIATKNKTKMTVFVVLGQAIFPLEPIPSSPSSGGGMVSANSWLSTLGDSNA